MWMVCGLVGHSKHTRHVCIVHILLRMLHGRVDRFRMYVYVAWLGRKQSSVSRATAGLSYLAVVDVCNFTGYLGG